MVDANPAVSIVPLNGNGLDVQVKRQIWSKQIKKRELYAVSKKPTLNIETQINSIKMEKGVQY